MFDPKDYPFVATLRFKTAEEAGETLCSMEDEYTEVKYNESEVGQNIYFVNKRGST